MVYMGEGVGALFAGSVYWEPTPTLPKGCKFFDFLSGTEIQYDVGLGPEKCNLVVINENCLKITSGAGLAVHAEEQICSGFSFLAGRNNKWSVWCDEATAMHQSAMESICAERSRWAHGSSSLQSNAEVTEAMCTSKVEIVKNSSTLTGVQQHNGKQQYDEDSFFPDKATNHVKAASSTMVGESEYAVATLAGIDTQKRTQKIDHRSRPQESNQWTKQQDSWWSQWQWGSRWSDWWWDTDNTDGWQRWDHADHENDDSRSTVR